MESNGSKRKFNMIALMCDGLELGKFDTDDKGNIQLILNKGVEKYWLPYVFEEALENKVPLNSILEAWKKERVLPKNRFGAKRLLKGLGLKRYSVENIAYITRCSTITDPYWIVYEEYDRYYEASIRGKLGETRFPYNSIGIVDEREFTWRK